MFELRRHPGCPGRRLTSTVRTTRPGTSSRGSWRSPSLMRLRRCRPEGSRLASRGPALVSERQHRAGTHACHWQSTGTGDGRGTRRTRRARPTRRLTRLRHSSPDMTRNSSRPRAPIDERQSDVGASRRGAVELRCATSGTGRRVALVPQRHRDLDHSSRRGEKRDSHHAEHKSESVVLTRYTQ